MNRTILMVAGVTSASSLLLVDSAVKGTALLALAALAAIMLRRDSAATRHLVWLLTMVALLAVPVLSAMLPEWRVLPEWASIPPAAVVADLTAPSIESARNAAPDEVESPSAAAHQPAAALPDSRPAVATPGAMLASAGWSWNWQSALPLAWAIGFSVLILRLMAARLMLWNSERQGTVIWPSRQFAATIRDPFVTALEAACLQLGICRPVTLLIHPDKTIPVVWGILRCRLLLPAAARHWSGEQLRSVLLHELAHIKRRDTVAQLLTQIACALYWFNPLVWFAAWRLGVERERACDDLVLASGVRPSAYAGHLLDVVTGLLPARWTQSCGLAMARKSSLEGRLVAVLSQSLNRRGVSVALAGIALAIAVGVAVPIAMLRAAEERPGAPMQQESQRPKEGAKLEPGMEEKLKWGEAVKGLRAALIIRHVSDEPKAGERPDLYLVVQNVSKAPIRLTDANTPANVNLRVLYFQIDGDTKGGLGAREPALGEFMLQPREVAFLPMFSLAPMNSPDSKEFDGHTLGSYFAKSALEDARQTLLARMEIEKAPAGAWTGKLATGETSGAAAAGGPQPKSKQGQALFKMWQHHARANGNIPGGLVDRLGDKVKEFIRNNTGDVGGDAYAKKMAPLVPRFEAARDRDWKPAEVVALMDDIAAAHTIPLETTREEIEGRRIKTGTLLPKALANAPWGEALPNGLRLAWLLEPRAAEHRLGTPLKSRILLHNAGKIDVVFRTRTWHQSGGHKARDANGADIQIESTEWTTIGRLTTFRLAPGEFIELNAAGIGVGANKNDEDWQNTRVGSWIDAKAGDDVTFTPDAVPLYDRNEDIAVLGGEPRWWLDFITARLARHLPLPAEKAERERILYRVAMDLFGTPVSDNDFLADREPTALDSLAKRLFHRPGLHAWAGPLASAPTKFRVLPADPDAAKKPRTASNPGGYTLNGYARLQVSRRLDGERIVNEASIHFSDADPTRSPPKPHQLKLPDDYNTWAAAWIRGGTVLWVMQAGAIRSYDFANPAQVKETALEDPANLDKVPRAILDALRAVLDVPGAPRPATEAPRK
jgi:beta-lactamase regulating signal transducer with metallopeptidase domain